MKIVNYDVSELYIGTVFRFKGKYPFCCCAIIPIAARNAARLHYFAFPDIARVILNMFSH